MSSACSITGNADLYGLGNRVGFYLQLYSIIFAAWACPTEVPKLCIANTLFRSIVFVTVVTQLLQSNALSTLDIYIALLLWSSSTINNSLIRLLWRMVTGFNPRWDPSRYRKSKPASRWFSRAEFLVLDAIFVFEIWFWTARVWAQDQCEQYGFLFSKVKTESKAFRFTNLGLSYVRFTITTVFLLANLVPRRAAKLLRVKNQEQRISDSLIKAYLAFNLLTDFVVITTIIVATELVIHWNNISGVNSVRPVGQTIPLLTGIACTGRVIYVAAQNYKNEPISKGGNEHGSGRDHHEHPDEPSHLSTDHEENQAPPTLALPELSGHTIVMAPVPPTAVPPSSPMAEPSPVSSSDAGPLATVASQAAERTMRPPTRPTTQHNNARQNTVPSSSQSPTSPVRTSGSFPTHTSGGSRSRMWLGISCSDWESAPRDGG